MLRDGIGIPLCGVILMLMPAVIVRLLRPPTREALDGFVIGALGALSFTAAATLTRLAPQFGTGVVSKRPMESLIVEAGIRGMAVPLTAAAAGGLIGAALWFTRPPSKEHQHPGVVRLVLVVLRGRGAGRVLGPRPDRRRPLSAAADVGPVPGLGSGGPALAAHRPAPGAAARSARRDPVRRAAAVPALRPRRSRHGVLPGLRGGHAGVVTLVPKGTARDAAGAQRGGTGGAAQQAEPDDR